MYSTCLFCNAALGKNEAIEHFPVGRRLAFDAAKGRLWVVCRKCERWNLTPLEERWEAIEECERAFRETKLRVSTDNVGLARIGEGLELVRIGAPQRPEMAAWRYGDQFGRRRRRFIAMTAGGVAAVGALVVAGPVAGIVSSGLLGQVPNILNITNTAYRARKRVRLPLAGGGFVETNLLNAARASLHEENGAPRLDLELAKPNGHLTLWGDDAVRGASSVLPFINRAGGGEREVKAAVRLVEQAPSIAQLYGQAAREARTRFDASMWQWGEAGLLTRLPASMRLALEMAAHEEQERRALEGELAELERAWQQAEEIAAIADNLLVGAGIRGRLDRLRGRDGS